MKYRKLKKYKYQVMEDIDIDLKTTLDIEKAIKTDFVVLSTTGHMSIKKGYAWNGANCFPDYQWILLPSLVHDILWQLIMMRLLPESFRTKSNKILREMCKDRLPNALKFMANLVYFAVEKIGGNLAETGQSQDIIYEVF